MKVLRSTGVCALAALLLQAQAASAQYHGSWTMFQAPIRVQDALLMMDGSVLVERYASSTGDWWRLRPDASGNYVNGTWSYDSSLPVIGGVQYAPLYYCSAVLPDGRAVVIGGEYNYQLSGASFTYVTVETNKGAIYDPATRTWTALPPPTTSRVGDSMCSVLTTGPHKGQLAIGPNSGSKMYVLDPVALTWTDLGVTGKVGSNSEEGWTLLPDGTLYDVLANGTAANGTSNLTLRYIPTLNQWVSAGVSPVLLKDTSSHETGAQVLMYNGSVFVAGADRNSGANVVFTPPPGSTVDNQLTAQGTFLVAPAFPRKPAATAPPMTNCIGTAPNLMCQLDDADAPGALLPNGHVLVPAAPGVFNPDTYFFEYDPSNNTLNEIARPSNASTQIQYAYHMLLLPNGQVFAPTGGTLVPFYTMDPTTGPDPSWKPVITSVPHSLTPGQRYSLSGMQINGLTEGAYYGDDYSSATNYPIVRITNHATGHVFWGRPHDRDNLTITAGNTVITTALDIPANLEPGTSDLVVIANGIASDPVEINHPPVTTASLDGTAGSNGWFLSDVQVTLHATDPDAPNDVAATYYSVDGGPVQTYGAPFTVSGDGVHQVTFWSVDKAGDTEAANTQSIKIDTTAPSLTASASLTSLWPPNNKMVDDVVNGTLGDGTSGLDPASVTFTVVDSYGAVQPSGSVTVNPDGTFSFVVSLEASRLGTDLAGRTYTITVRATDQAGNTSTAIIVVTVPHDQGQ
jgi:Kelch motif